MAEFFVLRIGEDAAQPASWIAVDDRGTCRGKPGRGTLAEAAAALLDRTLIVLIPASEALTFAVDIPAKGSRLLAALPYALEDQVADDIDDLHFAPGKRNASGKLAVAVVANSSLEGWQARLSEAGLAPASIIPENHGLARTPNTMSLLVDGDQIFFNDGADMSFVIAGISPSEAVAAAGFIDDDQSGASQHLLVYCDAALNDRYEKDWALLRHELASVDVNLLADGVLPRLAVTVASGEGINLLQGRYGPRTEITAMLRPWRYAAIFLLALGFVGLIGKAADFYRLSAEQSALRLQFTEEYRLLRPNDTREIVNPVTTVRDLRRSNSAGSTAAPVFLPLLSQLAEALQQNEEAVLESARYRAGVIDVRLNAPDVPTLDRIVQAVNASGEYSATLQSADSDSDGDRVNSQIRVSEAGT